MSPPSKTVVLLNLGAKSSSVYRVVLRWRVFLISRLWQIHMYSDDWSLPISSTYPTVSQSSCTLSSASLSEWGPNSRVQTSQLAMQCTFRHLGSMHSNYNHHGLVQVFPLLRTSVAIERLAYWSLHVCSLFTETANAADCDCNRHRTVDREPLVKLESLASVLILPLVPYLQAAQQSPDVHDTVCKTPTSGKVHAIRGWAVSVVLLIFPLGCTK